MFGEITFYWCRQLRKSSWEFISSNTIQQQFWPKINRDSFGNHRPIYHHEVISAIMRYPSNPMCYQSNPSNGALKKESCRSKNFIQIQVQSKFLLKGLQRPHNKLGAIKSTTFCICSLSTKMERGVRSIRTTQ